MSANKIFNYTFCGVSVPEDITSDDIRILHQAENILLRMANTISRERLPLPACKFTHAANELAHIINYCLPVQIDPSPQPTTTQDTGSLPLFSHRQGEAAAPWMDEYPRPRYQPPPPIKYG